jgi:hypothetical protein
VAGAFANCQLSEKTKKWEMGRRIMHSAGAHECGSIYMKRDSLTLGMLLVTKKFARQQASKTAINSGMKVAGNAALSLMASLYAKFTFIYREANLIVLLKDVKLP